MRTVDGRSGGGQVLRSALALALHTGEAVRVEAVRATRPRPGLARQHLTAVRAAQAVCGAEVEGAEVGSSVVTFRPGQVVPGSYEFDVGSAGSTGLVLQTVLLALATAGAPSHLRLRGGTHNAWAPPFDFLERTFLPALARMGPTCTAHLERHGFYPAGGGRTTVEVAPVPRLAPFTLEERGAVRAVRARVLVAGVPAEVAERERRALLEATGWAAADVTVEHLPKRHGPGNVLLVEVETDAVTTVLTAFGRRGVSAEALAREVAASTAAYVGSGAPVDTHLADQLLLPLAFAGRGAFRTVAPVDVHTTTNAALVSSWLGVPVRVEEESERVARVTVG
jgi:RNA 3'-terminal phosphate cyclase (ATP)